MENNNIQITPNLSLYNPQNKTRMKAYRICEYCYTLSKKKDVLKCSGKDCKVFVCKKCLTYINDKPFCNNCVVDIVRNNSLLLITRKDL